MIRKISFWLLAVTAAPLLLGSVLFVLVGIPVCICRAFASGDAIAYAVVLALAWVAFVNLLFQAACEYYDMKDE